MLFLPHAKVIIVKKELWLKNGNILRNSSRGSAMVESSIYFPIIILASMFIIYMMINMYSETAFQAKLNKEVRAESMKIIGNAEVSISKDGKDDKYRKVAEAREISYSDGGKYYATSYIVGSGMLEMKGEILTGYKRIKNRYSARAFSISEKNYIWDIIDDVT